MTLYPDAPTANDRLLELLTDPPRLVFGTPSDPVAGAIHATVICTACGTFEAGGRYAGDRAFEIAAKAAAREAAIHEAWHRRQDAIADDPFVGL